MQYYETITLKDGKEEVVALAHVSSGNQLEYGFFRVLLIQQAHVHILAVTRLPQVGQT